VDWDGGEEAEVDNDSEEKGEDFSSASDAAAAFIGWVVPVLVEASPSGDEEECCRQQKTINRQREQQRESCCCE
jgi:hypothetical protein